MEEDIEKFGSLIGKLDEFTIVEMSNLNYTIKLTNKSKKEINAELVIETCLGYGVNIYICNRCKLKEAYVTVEDMGMIDGLIFNTRLKLLSQI